MSDALFDLTDFAPPYTGPVPPGFVRDFYPSDELVEAAQSRGRADLHHWRQYHPYNEIADRGPAGCEMREFVADLRCTTRGPNGHRHRMFWRQASPDHLWRKAPDVDQRDVRCQCVGELVHMCVCDRCGWNAIGDERDARVAWLDHGWPGWRDLPAIPSVLTPPFGGALIPKNGSPNPEDVKAGRAAHAWAVDNFPAKWQVQGAPAVAYRRPEKNLGRGVIKGYAPFGGFLVFIPEEIAA